MRRIRRLLQVGVVILLLGCSCHGSKWILKGNEEMAIASHSHEYDSEIPQASLVYGEAERFRFQRRLSILRAKEAVNLKKKAWKRHECKKDGRKGLVSSMKLGGDWVLAESEQVAIQCTAKEVLQAYLSADLQQQWNEREVLKCHFHRKSSKNHTDMTFLSSKATEYYQQDLVLRSQRVIKSHTGIMKYSQIILIDKIGNDKYSVLIRLIPEHSTTHKRPFDSLSVYVGLQQNGENTDIYAAGVMKVNRQVVPNLLIFDASGIAGSMAGKGTLWLAAFFEKRFLSQPVFTRV